MAGRAEFEEEIKNMLRNKSEQIKSTEQEPSEEEIIFREVIADEIIDEMSRELRDFSVGEKAIEEFVTEIKKIDDWQELSALLSWPRSLRKRLFTGLNGKDGRQILAELRGKLKMLFDYNHVLPKLGFHTTGEEIKSIKNTRGELVWEVKGREVGDLDVGRQAFAADRLSGIYHEGQSDRMYVVRIMDDSGLYDTQQGWHHAPNFPIVMELKTDDVYEKIKQKKEQLEDQKFAA